jgi:deoxyadenosine/deoxycytidine kinase
MPIIVIDGNIGSGKTTQLDLLEKKGWKVRREPIEQWPLKKFYADPARWAFYFHMVLLKTLKRPPGTAICERSPYSARYVFWPVLLKQNSVTKEEDETYDYFWNKFSWCPDLYIFLSKKPELAFEHIQTRGQAGDDGVSLEYLNELDFEYKKLLMKIPCKVIVVNANRTPEEIHTEICRHLSENELFLYNEERRQVQETSGPRRQVQCTPFDGLCRVS